MTLLKAQFIGSAIVTCSTFAVAMLVMWLVNPTGMLRVSKEGETVRSRSARARHLGLSGICDYSAWFARRRADFGEALSVTGEGF